MIYVKGSNSYSTGILPMMLLGISTALVKPYPLPREIYPDLIQSKKPLRPSALGTRPIVWTNASSPPKP